MGENIQLRWDVSRVEAATLLLLEDEERRCLDLSIAQVSVLRQMAFPWAYLPRRLVEDHGEYQTIVEMPQEYVDALEELEVLLSGAYDGPAGGCPVGEVYVDRGAAVAFDFTIGSGLTADSAWHDLDLGSLITDSDATLVLLYCYVKDGSAGLLLNLRKELDPNNTKNCAPCQTEVANQYLYHHPIVALASRKIQYLISSGMDDCGIFVRGWWKPNGYGA